LRDFSAFGSRQLRKLGVVAKADGNATLSAAVLMFGDVSPQRPLFSPQKKLRDDLCLPTFLATGEPSASGSTEVYALGESR
jgi:hypothetical protein